MKKKMDHHACAGAAAVGRLRRETGACPDGVSGKAQNGDSAGTGPESGGPGRLYLRGGIVSFFLNKYFTFQSKTREWSQVWKFALNVTACYLLGYGLAKPLVLRLLAGQAVSVQENVAMLVGMCLYTGLNYLGQRFFVFKVK